MNLKLILSKIVLFIPFILLLGGCTGISFTQEEVNAFRSVRTANLEFKRTMNALPTAEFEEDIKTLLSYYGIELIDSVSDMLIETSIEHVYLQSANYVPERFKHMYGGGTKIYSGAEIRGYIKFDLQNLDSFSSEFRGESTRKGI